MSPEQFLVAVAEHQSAFKKMVESNLQPMLRELNLGQALIQAYTPGFNDGEPCEHSSRTYIAPLDRWDDDEEYVDVALNKDMTKEQIQTAHQILEIYDEHVLHPSNGTNYQVLITRQPDGTYSFSQDEYDCGY